MEKQLLKAKSFALLPEDYPVKIAQLNQFENRTVRTTQLLFRNRPNAHFFSLPEKKGSKSPVSLSPLKRTKLIPEQLVKQSIDLQRQIPKKNFAINSINDLKSLKFSLNPSRSEQVLKRHKEGFMERPNHILEEIYTRWDGEPFSQFKLNDLVLEIEIKPQRYSYPIRKFSKKFLEDLASVLKGREILKDAMINMHYNKVHAMGNYRMINEALKNQSLKQQKLIKDLEHPRDVFRKLEMSGYLTISGSMNLEGILNKVAE